MSAESVTLYIPVYNAGMYLKEVLPGVFSQTHQITELLVIDDGSTDNSVELVEQASRTAPFPVRLIRHPGNLGLGAARNTAIENAKTPFLAAIDSDVVLEPQWLATLMPIFSSPDIAGVGGTLIEKYVDGPGNKWRDTFMRQSYGDSEKDVQGLFGSNTVFRTQVLRDVGGYNRLCRTNGEDVELSWRIKEKGLRLRYTPKAQCWHLRQDDIRSIMNTFWRWLHFSKLDPRPGLARTLRSTMYNFRDVIWTGRRIFQERALECLIVAVMMPFYRSYKDWEYYFRSRAVRTK